MAPEEKTRGIDAGRIINDWNRDKNASQEREERQQGCRALKYQD